MSVRAVTIQDILSGTADLPVFGETASQLLKETSAEDSPPARVADLLSRDQSLAMRILRLANSAYFGLPRRIDSIPQAVLVLGLNRVRQITLAASSYVWLQRPLSGYFVSPRELWIHSMGTAAWARLIAELSGRDGEAAFTSGLVHDIGKVALCAWHDERMKAIVRFAQRQNMPYDEAERRVFGFDHAEIGARLCECWNLPEVVVTAVRWHHRADQSPECMPLADCVHAAVGLNALAGRSIDQPAMTEEECAAACAKLGLDLEIVLAKAEEVVLSLMDMEQALAA